MSKVAVMFVLTGGEKIKIMLEILSTLTMILVKINILEILELIKLKLLRCAPYSSFWVS